MTPDLRTLSDFLIGEIVKAFGLPRKPFTTRLLRPFFHGATDRLAALGLDFDWTVQNDNIATAAENLLRGFCHPVRASGTGNIPAEGPLLVVSNHPGTYDSLVLFSQVKRPDVRFIGSRIPFVVALPHASQHFIFVTLNPRDRVAGIRQAIRHLRAGGAVLVFGSGHIDPDPSVYNPAGTLQHIQRWWPSAEFLLNKVPDTKLVLSVISHVVSPHWAWHPITWLRRGDVDRRRLAQLGQLVQQLLAPGSQFLAPRISFSHPYSVDALHRETGAERLMPAIFCHAGELLRQHLSTFNDFISVPGQKNPVRSSAGMDHLPGNTMRASDSLFEDSSKERCS
jgi:hypothetical protein